MVRHNVYFWLDESLSDDDKVAFEGGLGALFEMRLAPSFAGVEHPA